VQAPSPPLSPSSLESAAWVRERCRRGRAHAAGCHPQYALHSPIHPTPPSHHGEPGLSHDQLEHIARAGTSVRKVSRRDLPLVVALKADGATTVSATMLLAARAGIKVFVTGGIGGVHR